MRIRRRQRIQAVLTLGVVAAVGLFLYVMTGISSDRIKDALLIEDIGLSVFEIHALTSDYLLHSDERTIQQWRSRHGTLEELLGELRVEKRTDRAVLEIVANNNRDIALLFENLVEDTRKLKINRDPAYRELLVSQLLTRTQAMVSAAYQLSRTNRSRLTGALRAGGGGIIAAVSLLLFVAAGSVLLGRSLIRSLETLRHGTGIVAAGNLDHRVGIDSPDELGELARDFDHMTESLKNSREALSREQAELRKSEALFQRLFDQSPLGAALVSLDFRFLRVNETFSRITGYSPEEMVSLVFPDISHPEDLEADLAGAERLVAGEIEQYEMEKRYIRKDGGIVWVRLNARGIRDEEGRLLYFLPFAEDVTERKAMEGALRRSHEVLEERVRERTAELVQANAALRETTRTLEELVHASPVGITVLDPEGKVLLWNPAMERIYGWTEGEVLEKLFPTVAAGQEGAKETLERLLAGERLAGVELRRERKDGRPVDLLLWTAPLWEESGRLKSTVAIFMDVTQLKEMEQVALTQQKLASLGQVAVSVAHEIRNPLSGINLYLHSLETFLGEWEIPDPEIREQTEAVVAGMKGASTKMESVIQRVLSFSRPGPPRMEPLDLNGCIREAVDMARISLQKAGVQVSVALQEDLPACRGDTSLLAQALLNLLTNAAQALEGQEGKKVIEIRSSRSSASSRNGFVTVSVADSGPGVPEGLREKVFDPFFTTKSSGTGIGLAITQKIVSDHGGFLRVGKSRIGGALFTIGLPMGGPGATAVS
jgi:PAS domain S-box-containing protein